jgi:hypothetical protein
MSKDSICHEIEMLNMMIAFVNYPRIVCMKADKLILNESNSCTYYMKLRKNGDFSTTGKMATRPPVKPIIW